MLAGDITSSRTQAARQVDTVSYADGRADQTARAGSRHERRKQLTGRPRAGTPAAGRAGRRAERPPHLDPMWRINGHGFTSLTSGHGPHRVPHPSNETTWPTRPATTPEPRAARPDRLRRRRATRCWPSWAAGARLVLACARGWGCSAGRLYFALWPDRYTAVGQVHRAAGQPVIQADRAGLRRRRPNRPGCSPPRPRRPAACRCSGLALAAGRRHRDVRLLRRPASSRRLQHLQGELDVAAGRESAIITVALTTHDRAESEALVQAVMDSYAALHASGRRPTAGAARSRCSTSSTTRSTRRTLAERPAPGDGAARSPAGVTSLDRQGSLDLRPHRRPAGAVSSRPRARRTRPATGSTALRRAVPHRGRRRRAADGRGRAGGRRGGAQRRGGGPRSRPSCGWPSGGWRTCTQTYLPSHPTVRRIDRQASEAPGRPAHNLPGPLRRGRPPGRAARGASSPTARDTGMALTADAAQLAILRGQGSGSGWRGSSRSWPRLKRQAALVAGLGAARRDADRAGPPSTPRT